MKSTRAYSREIRSLVGIIIASWLLSFAFAFYWWSENRTTEILTTRTRILRLMTVKEFVHETQSKFQMEIHQWKNLLIRYDNPKRFEKNLASFRRLCDETQGLLIGTHQMALRENLNDAALLQTLIAEHAAIDQRYLNALTHLNPHDPASVAVVDNLVYGVDRHMVRSLGAIADHIGGRVDLETDTLGNQNNHDRSWWGSYGTGLLFLQGITMIAFARLFKVNQLVDKRDKRAAVIFKSIGDALVVVDNKARIEYLNSPAEQLLGL